MELNRYVTDGNIITDGKSALGIFSATDYLNSIIDKLEVSDRKVRDLEKENSNLKKELFSTYKFISRRYIDSEPIEMSAYMINRMNNLKEWLKPSKAMEIKWKKYK